MALASPSRPEIPGTTPTRNLVVLKLGGSLLTGLPAYQRCAQYLRHRCRRDPAALLVVVSARQGQTDRLDQLAQRLAPAPDPHSRDLLWATGELRSVALLTLCLHRLGIDARGLNVHQSGLHATEDAICGFEVQVNAAGLQSWLSRHRVVVVPGFLARDDCDAVVSLGRGGSDLTAVLLAAALQASRCELIKDVGGYHTADPHQHHDARPLPALDYRQALTLAAGGCPLVQPRALQAAARAGVPLVVAGLDPNAPHTLITAALPRQNPCPPNGATGRHHKP